MTWPVTKDRGFAPAKVNLTLHVTGQRADGYHTLDSLVVFAEVGDRIAATAALDLSLTVTGPFAQGVPIDASNLVMRAARALQQARGVKRGAVLRLTKNLPHAAGIGGGSADAAATLKLLAELWNVPPLGPGSPEILALGADVPACLRAPQPTRIRGAGEVFAPVPALPACGLVLVNPGVGLPTRDVFAALTRKDNAPMSQMPESWDFDSFVAWLKQQRNDLQAPAEKLAPAIGAVLTRLRSMPAVQAAVMSGSGATCVGLVRDMGVARQVARVIQVANMGWWVAPAPLLRG
jgi:4-diphosphocytidyl-2-C-methyl-D-erythritol kinase